MKNPVCSGLVIYIRLQIIFVAALLAVPCLQAATPYQMSGGNYSEGFDSISTWADNFASGTGAAPWSSVANNTTAGSGDGVPNPTKETTSTATFSSSTSGGVQRGTGTMNLLATGSSDNETAVAVDLNLDFTGMTAGTLSFDWAEVNDSTGNRVGSLRVYTSTDGATFTELVGAGAQVYNNTNASGTVSSIALPASFSQSSTARIRFYCYNGTNILANGGIPNAGNSGSRPKISLDNIAVTATGGLTATQVGVETKADGTGIAVGAQSLGYGASITAYAISRDGSGNFVANVAADSWSLVNITGGVVSGDLVPSGDSKSAVFTANMAGSANIHVVSGSLTPVDSGTITTTNLPPTITDQPASVVVALTTNTSFAVTAAGSPTLYYQWLQNGTNISGATASSFSIASVASTNAGSYDVIITNAAGSVTSSVATLTIAASTFTLMTYNVDGNSITGTSPTNWAVAAPQVQSIGREITYLNPDIITFNEIPSAYMFQMTNWQNAFLSNYFLATNSVGDGEIQNVVASKFPVLMSVSHLHGTSLAPYGYTNSSTFTRDLFEVELNVPGLSAPLHVFDAHLKATDSSPEQDDANKRAAEAAAVSNYFVTVFLPGTNGAHPYTLSGDMNEDAFYPETNDYTSGHPLQSLTATPTGLNMTIPLNPITQTDLTESIRLPLDTRFDYILPCGSLYSNILSSQVFRTDLLNPLPSGLNSNDDSIASDHLPVLMTFNNPIGSPPTISIGPGSLTNMAGSTAHFSVVAGGATPLNYQWMEGSTALTDGGNIYGSATSTLTLSNVIAATAGSYSVTVSNDISSTNSVAAILSVIDPGATIQPTSQTIIQSNTAIFTATVGGTGTLTYQWQKSGTGLSDGGDIVGSSTTALTITNAAAGDIGTYAISVTGSLGTTVSSNVTLAVVLNPSITSGPTSKTVNAGTIATFTANTIGNFLTYIWSKNGTPLSNGGNILGATTATLSITNCLAADMASYSVTISNAANMVSSTNAVLTVIDPAINTQPKDNSATLGGTATFTVGAAGTPTLTYQWQKNNAALSDGGNISGSSTATLTVSSVADSDIASYNVIAQNGISSATSSNATIFIITGTGELVLNGLNYSQNFDSMGTATNLPGGWRMTPAATSSPAFGASNNTNFVNQVVSSGSPTTGGRYNWGNGGNTSDRAVGFMTSGSYGSPNSIMAGFYNNSSGTILSLAVSFNYERYRINMSPAQVSFFTSTDGINWTSDTDGDSGAFATGANTYEFSNPDEVNKSFVVSGLSLAPGATFYLRWNFNTTGSNSQGLGLDDFTMALTTLGTNTPASPTLNAGIVSTNFVLSWTTNNTADFLLQTTATMSADPAIWQTVGQNQTVVGGQNVVTIPVSNNPAFFRLKTAHQY